LTTTCDINATSRCDFAFGSEESLEIGLDASEVANRNTMLCYQYSPYLNLAMIAPPMDLNIIPDVIYAVVCD